MNVFVLSTGRCGSTTFAEACRHITNFTAAHESNWGRVGPTRLQYPDNHIEVDNRLSWMLGELDRRYGQDAFYVHLRRDPERVAASFARRWGGESSIIRAFGKAVLAVPRPSLDICRAYVSCIDANIKLFLRDKPKQISITLENVTDTFPMFWQHIGARGDLDSALETFARPHNSSAKRSSGTRRLVRRAIQRVVRNR